MGCVTLCWCSWCCRAGESSLFDVDLDLYDIILFLESKFSCLLQYSIVQRYIGGLLCTPGGELPLPEDLDEIWQVLRSAEIEPWELFVVNNDEKSPGALEAGPAPLDFYRKTASVIS